MHRGILRIDFLCPKNTPKCLLNKISLHIFAKLTPPIYGTGVDCYCQSMVHPRFKTKYNFFTPDLKQNIIIFTPDLIQRIDKQRYNGENRNRATDNNAAISRTANKIYEMR